MSPKSAWIDDWEKMAWRKQDRASHRLLSIGLCPLGWVYGWISKRYAILQGRPKELNRPVISVGNLTVGGSGKTPFTIYLAKRISGRWNKKVAVVSRGYGKKEKDAITVVSDGEKILCSPDEAGDEAYLTAVKVPGAIVVTCPNRYEASQVAIEEFGAEAILLDDGFQHRRLIRDSDLVMVDAERGFGNGRCLPAGPLREPLSGLGRADWLILYRRSFGNIQSGLKDSLSRLVEKNIRTLEILASIRSVEKYVPDDTSQENLHQETLDWVQARALRWLLVSGIAYPRSFERAAAELKIPAVEHLVFEDHHAYSEGDWETLFLKAKQREAGGILTTEKDFWKLMHQADSKTKDRLLSLPFATLSLEVDIIQGESEFLADLERVMESCQGT